MSWPAAERIIAKIRFAIRANGGKIVIVRGDGRIKHEDSYIVEAIVDVYNISTSKEILSSNARRIIQNGIANLLGN